MDSPGIVAELDVLGDVGPGALPCRVDSTVNTLVLQRAEERFGHGVILAYPGSTHRLPGPVFREGLGEAAGSVVAAPVGVEDRVVGGVIGPLDAPKVLLLGLYDQHGHLHLGGSP